MTDRELDQFVAEHVMGWTDLEWREAKRDWNSFSPKGWFGKGPNGGCFFREGHFTQDLNACREAELKIDVEEWLYAEMLIKVMNPLMWRDWDEIGEPLQWSIIISATARQRCEAMYQALEEGI